MRAFLYRRFGQAHQNRLRQRTSRNINLHFNRDGIDANERKCLKLGKQRRGPLKGEGIVAGGGGGGEFGEKYWESGGSEEALGCEFSQAGREPRAPKVAALTIWAGELRVNLALSVLP